MKPSRLVWLAPLLMAMEGPSCVMSEDPLTRPGRGFVDEAVLGEWIDSESPEDGFYEVRRRGEGSVEVRWHFDDGSYLSLAGYSSRLGDASFANLQFVDAGCVGCSDEQLAEVQSSFRDDFAEIRPDNPGNRCTWVTMPYELLEDGSLRIGMLRERPVLERMEAGGLDGDRDADDDTGDETGDESDVVCITESRRGLRELLAAQGLDGPLIDAGLLIRPQR